MNKNILLFLLVVSLTPVIFGGHYETSAQKKERILNQLRNARTQAERDRLRRELQALEASSPLSTAIKSKYGRK